MHVHMKGRFSHIIKHTGKTAVLSLLPSTKDNSVPSKKPCCLPRPASTQSPSCLLNQRAPDHLPLQPRHFSGGYPDPSDVMGLPLPAQWCCQDWVLPVPFKNPEQQEEWHQPRERTQKLKIWGMVPKCFPWLPLSALFTCKQWTSMFFLYQGWAEGGTAQ